MPGPLVVGWREVLPLVDEAWQEELMFVVSSLQSADWKIRPQTTEDEVVDIMILAYLAGENSRIANERRLNASVRDLVDLRVESLLLVACGRAKPAHNVRSIRELWIDQGQPLISAEMKRVKTVEVLRDELSNFLSRSLNRRLLQNTPGSTITLPQRREAVASQNLAGLGMDDA